MGIGHVQGRSRVPPDRPGGGAGGELYSGGLWCIKLRTKAGLSTRLARASPLLASKRVAWMPAFRVAAIRCLGHFGKWVGDGRH